MLGGEHYDKKGHIFLGNDVYERLVPADAAAEIETLHIILGIPAGGQHGEPESSPTEVPVKEPPAS